MDKRTEAREAIGKSERTEGTVILPYHYELESELNAHADMRETYIGIDGREARAFCCNNALTMWRVLLLLPLVPQSCQYR